MADLSYDILMRYREAVKGLTELEGGAEKFLRKLKELDRTTANPEVDLVTKEAQAKLKKLKAELDNLNNIKLKIDADTAKAKASISGVERELERLQKQPVSVEVTARIAIAQTRLKQLKTELATLKDARLNVDANVSEAKAQIAGLNSNIDRLERSRSTTLTVGADTSGADRQVGAFTTQMRSRLTAAINALPDIVVTADSSEMDRHIAAIRAQLMSLTDPEITPNFNDAGVRAQIAALSAQLRLLSTQDVDIEANFNATAALAQMAVLRRTMGDTGQQGSILFRILGGGVSALGSLVGASTKAGSAMTSLGTSIAGVGGGAVEAGSAFGGMSRGGIMLATSLASLAVSLPLIAGAMGLAVAAVGQLGGAMIALGSGIVPLVGNLGLLPGLLLPIGLAAGAVAIAFGDAGLKKEVENLKASFNPLINDIRNQLRPALTGLLQSVAELVPTFRAAAPAITSAISDVSNQFSNMFRSSSFKADLQSILTASGGVIRDFGAAAQSGLRGFMDIMVAARPVVSQFSLYIRNVADEFANMMAEGRRTGELTTFFSQALSVFQQVMGVVRNLGGLFKDLWDSANRTGAFQATLGAINDGITRFRDYVSQVGGAWDQLMSKAGTVTAQVIDLIGTIGDAFVQIANKVDLGPAVEGIKGLVRGLIPFFQDVGQAMSDAIGAVGPALGTAFEQWGPAAADAIRNIGLLVIELVGGVDELATYFRVAGLSAQQMWAFFTGDEAGVATAVAKIATELTGLQQRLGANQASADGLAAGLRGAGGAAKELADKIGAVPDDLQVKIDADTANAEAKKNQLLSTINTSTAMVHIDGNQVPAGTALQQVINAINAGRGSVTIDGQPMPVDQALQSVIARINGSNAEVMIGGQPYPAGQVLAALMGEIASSRGDVTVGGNPAPGHAAVGEVVNNANTAAGSVAIDGNPGPAQGKIAGVVDEANRSRGTMELHAIDNAARGVIQRLKDWASQAVSFVVRALPGNAAGGIMTPDMIAMQSGGLLPMDAGDMLDRARPMSGRTARIVPPNTPRLIGDRLVDDEAFIPINDSAWSTAILGETARRKGFALVPLATGRIIVPEDDTRAGGNPFTTVGNVAGRRAAARAASGRRIAEDDPGWDWRTMGNRSRGIGNGMIETATGPTTSTIGFSLTAMAHGGINSRNLRDERAWEWILQLLEGLRGRPGGGGPRPGPIGGVGGPAGPAPVGNLPSATLRTMYATTGGMASVTRANPAYRALTAHTDFLPGERGFRGGGGAVKVDLSNLSFRMTGNQLIDNLLEEVARAIRGRGGNPQQFFGYR